MRLSFALLAAAAIAENICEVRGFVASSQIQSKRFAAIGTVESTDATKPNVSLCCSFQVNNMWPILYEPLP